MRKKSVQKTKCGCGRAFLPEPFGNTPAGEEKKILFFYLSPVRILYRPVFAIFISGYD